MLYPIIRSLTTSDGARLDVLDHMTTTSVGICALLGPSTGPGEEIFSFFACTPAYILDQLNIFGSVAGRLLIVPTLTAATVRSAIQAICSQIEGETWNDIGQRFAEYALWEFENYTE